MLVGSVLRQRYKIIKHLGSGGFGDTYLAEDMDLPHKPQCVVKHLKPQSTNPSVLQLAQDLFYREAETLYRLGNLSNQIPKLFAHFEEKGEFYLVQEFVDGHNLSQEITSGKQLSETQVVAILRETMEILAVVHKHNVIHRDIKPENIMRRRDGKIVLIDFGAVKEIHGMTVTQGKVTSTVCIGTSGYMPNEQASGKPRLCSDIYALGMLSIYALTGIPPYQLPEDPTNGEIMWRHWTNVSDRFADILNNMVRYNFTQRYQNANEVLQALNSPLSPSVPHTSPEAVHVNVTPVSSPSPTTTNSFPSSWIDNKALKFTGLLGLAAASTFGISQILPNTNIKLTPSPTATESSANQTISAEDAWNQGNDKLQQQDYQGAIADYTQAISINSNYVEAYNNRGLAYHSLKNYQKALEDYTQAIGINPEYSQAYYNRGLSHYDSKNYQQAIADYNQAININPEYSQAYYNRGLTRYQLGQYQGALEDYTEAIRINPEYSQAYYNRGLTRYKLKDFTGEIADYTEAIKINPKYVQAYYNRGLANYELKQYDLAIEDYNQAIKIDPKYINAYYNRGLARRHLQDYEGAIEDYNQAINIDPKYVKAYYNRGNAYELLGQNQKAIQDFQKAAQLYQEAGDNQNYQASLERARKLQR